MSLPSLNPIDVDTLGSDSWACRSIYKRAKCCKPGSGRSASDIFPRDGILEQGVKIASSVKYSHDENRFGFGPVNDHIGTERPKQHGLASMHIVPPVTF